MKLELKENMYVRTKDGEIHKIKSINDEYIEYGFIQTAITNAVI